MGAGRKQTDAALVRACLAGDEAAWEALILRYRRLIFSIPVAYRIAPAEAEDIFQRVAVKLIENLAGVRKTASLSAWVAVTTRRECLGHLRGASRSTPIDESQEPAIPPPEMARALDAVEREHALARAFEALDERCRTLLAALYLEEPTPSYKELAARLGRSVGSLGPTRARCLAKLRKLFGDLGGRPP